VSRVSISSKPLRRIALALVAGAGFAHAAEPPADAVLADLPFLDPPDAPLAVRVDLAPEGGRALPLLLDTGSPESFATPLAAKDLGISLRRSKQTPYRRATRLGRDLQLIVDTRRGDTGSADGGEWAVAGARYLAPFVVEIDMPARRVRFLDAARWEVPAESDRPDAQVLPLRVAGGVPVIEIEVGAERVPAVLTTGAPGTLLLPGGYAADAGLVPDPEATKTLAPMPGAGALEAATAPKLRIGRFEHEDVPVLVAERGVHGAGPRSEARLGLELLAPYRIRIDTPHARLWIERPSPPADRPLPSAP
jgi:hypothetical protein